MAVLTTTDQLLSQKYIASTGYGDIYLQIYGRYNSYNSSAGTVNVTTTLTLWLTNGTMQSYGTSWTLDGQSGSGNINVGGGLTGLISSTYNVTVNNDGSSRGYTSNATYNSLYGNTGSMSASFDTPTVPRYASISSFSVAKRDETSVTFNWKTNATIDYAWYSTNNGSSWTGYDVADGTSGSFNVSGLSANTNYNFKLRVRRKDSQLNTTSNTVQQTTYSYPYVSVVGTSNLIIGNQQTLTLYNPLSRNTTIYMKKDNTSGTELYSGTSSGTSVTFTPDSTTLYNTIPNSTIANCVYYCVYSNNTTATKSGTYTINADECIPEFSDFAYSTDYSGLTGDTDTIINGVTTTTFTISTANKAVAKNGATISKYRVECGSVSDEVNEASGDLTKTLAGCNDAIIKVIAVDSRGVEKNVTKTVTNFKAYIPLSFNSIKVERKDGIDAESNLDFVVNYWNGNFGSKVNQITKIEYRTKESSSSTWSSWYNTISTSSVTYNNDEASITDVLIHANGSSGGFTVGTQYDIQVRVSDGNGTTILNTTTSATQVLTDGSVAFAVNKDSSGDYHFGINDMPDDDYSVSTQNINVSDGYYVNGTKIDLSQYLLKQWNYVGSATGANDVSLPDDWTEAYLVVDFGGTHRLTQGYIFKDMFDTSILPYGATNMWTMGLGFYPTSGSGTNATGYAVGIHIKSDKKSIGVEYCPGQTSSTTIYVWYR